MFSSDDGFLRTIQECCMLGVSLARELLYITASAADTDTSKADREVRHAVVRHNDPHTMGGWPYLWSLLQWFCSGNESPHPNQPTPSYD